MASYQDRRSALTKALSAWENEGGAVAPRLRRAAAPDHLIHGAIVVPTLMVSAAAAYAVMAALS